MRKNRILAGGIIAALLLLTVFGESVLPLLLLGAMALTAAVSLVLALYFSRFVTAEAETDSLAEKNAALDALYEQWEALSG